MNKNKYLAERLAVVERGREEEAHAEPQNRVGNQSAFHQRQQQGRQRVRHVVHHWIKRLIVFLVGWLVDRSMDGWIDWLG